MPAFSQHDEKKMPDLEIIRATETWQQAGAYCSMSR